MGRAVLVTRPEPGLGETCARLAALGWAPLAAPALVLESRALAPFPAPQAVLITSRAALPALAALPRALPLFAVGEASAAAARAAGFAAAEGAEGEAAALAALVAARCRPEAGPLLLAAGRGYAQDLAAALRGRGFRVARRIAYHVAPASALPETARRAMSEGQVAAALFFSPRSAACAMKLWRAAGLAEAARGIEALALSPRIAAVLAGFPWRAVRVAARPEQALLIDLLGLAPAGRTAGSAGGAG